MDVKGKHVREWAYVMQRVEEMVRLSANVAHG
jgi:hypothetical protein